MQTRNVPITQPNGNAASPYAALTITKRPNWTGLTAFDIWFNNLSIGTFLVATVGALLLPSAFAGLARYALPLALVLLVIDLALLVSDLGDPARFHHMLRVFKISSPMSFGTWSLSLYGVLLGIASVAAVLSWPLLGGVQAALAGAGLWGFIEGAGKLAAGLAIIPALGGILYKGVLFSVTSQPGWKDARWLGAYLSNSAVLLGCAVVALLATLAGNDAALRILRGAMLALLLLDLLLAVLLYAGVRSAYQARYPGRGSALALAVLLLGTLLPFAVLLLGAPVLAAPLVILSALIVRYAFVELPGGANDRRP